MSLTTCRLPARSIALDTRSNLTSLHCLPTHLLRRDIAPCRLSNPRVTSCSAASSDGAPRHPTSSNNNSNSGSRIKEQEAEEDKYSIGLTPKKLSLQQRTRVLKQSLLRRRDRFWTSLLQTSLIIKLQQILGPPILKVLQPFLATWSGVTSAFEIVYNDYNTWIEWDLLRVWRWDDQYSKEYGMIKRSPPYLVEMSVVLFYMALMPVSFTLTVVLPGLYAWIMWDDWWKSPVFAAMLVMTPLKYVPWSGLWCWLWPGIF